LKLEVNDLVNTLNQLEAKRKAKFGSVLNTFENNDKNIESKPETIESKPETIESKPETIESVVKPFTDNKDNERKQTEKKSLNKSNKKESKPITITCIGF